MPVTVENVRMRLAEARALILSPSPDGVMRSIPLLEQAVTCMQSLEPAPAMLPELRALQFEIGVVARLVVRGAAYYRNWAKTLAAAAGYTAAGEPAPLTAAHSVSVEG